MIVVFFEFDFVFLKIDFRVFFNLIFVYFYVLAGGGGGVYGGAMPAEAAGYAGVPPLPYSTEVLFFSIIKNRHFLIYIYILLFFLS